MIIIIISPFFLVFDSLSLAHVIIFISITSHTKVTEKLYYGVMLLPSSSYDKSSFAQAVPSTCISLLFYQRIELMEWR